jgi:hypothetical protein
MQKIYKIDSSIYREFLIEKAILDYDEFFRRENIQASYHHDQIIFDSSHEVDDIFHEFTNYLLSLHVV